jgi:putative addiction module component (TIGR02574 family)
MSKAEILKLSTDEKIELVEAIWDSLLETEPHLPLTESQAKELDHRLATKDIKGGSSWAEVKSRIQKRT